MGLTMRTLKRRKKSDFVEMKKPHKIKRYMRKKCDFIGSTGIKCKKRAVGKGTLCKLHGGNAIVKSNLIPIDIEDRQLFAASHFKPELHPIAFIDHSRRGLSEVEIASLFEVSISTIKTWAETYESFSVAYEIGQAMHEAWWITQGKANLNARDFNTPLFKFLTSNKLGYSDKMETKSMNLNIHGVLKVPDSVTEDEWENETDNIVDVN